MVTTSTHLRSYTYDDKGQLVDAVRTDPDDVEVNTMTYSYDEIGNRTSSSEDTLERSYTANDLNQYTSINSETPTYDADGNMLTNGSWTYTWNTENRLASATDGVSILEFKYDFMGRRVEKKVTQNAIIIKHENYVYDAYKLIAVYDALNENALVMSFVWQVIDLDVPLCMIYNGNTYFYLTDGNKNVTGLFDITGNRIATYTYAPYGAILSSSGALSSINPFRFSSEYYDAETDLIYYNYRYYSPQLGRWTKRDPIAEQGGWNLYQPFINSPVANIDFLGLKWIINRDSSETKSYVYSDNPSNDDIDDLAINIGLNAADFTEWASDITYNISGNLDISYKVGTVYQAKNNICSLYIPNVIVALWAGNVGRIGRFHINWNYNIEQFKKANFHILEYKADSKTPKNHYATLLTEYAKNKELYGTYYWGHGYFPYPSSGLVSADGVSLLRYKGFSLPYRIAFAYIFACDTNSGKDAFNPIEWKGFTGTLVPINPWDSDWDLPIKNF